MGASDGVIFLRFHVFDVRAHAYGFILFSWVFSSSLEGKQTCKCGGKEATVGSVLGSIFLS